MGGRKHPEQPLLYVDTRNILFFVSGAFVGLDEIIRRRLGTSGKIGYGVDNQKLEKDDLYRYVTPQDLRTYGMIPEFVGRFPVITNVDPLKEADLETILVKPKNALVRQYTEMLSYDGIKLDFAKDALHEVAHLAVGLGTGARGLRSIMETVMMDTMYEAPKGKSGDVFKITAEMVRERVSSKFGKID